MAESFDPDKFWQFSLDIYGQDGVKECCLSLQNDHGTDVNLLLLCLWLDNQNISISAECFKDLMDISDHWQLQVLAPLRTNRSVLEKNTTDYEAALALELATEKKEQKALIEQVNRAEVLSGDPTCSKNMNCHAYANAKPFPIEALPPLINRQC